MGRDAKTRAKRRWFRRDDRHALEIGAAFVAVLISGAVFMIREAPRSAPRTVAAAPADDDLTTGSIIFMPVAGDICRNHLIDNATWMIRDNGVVDCRTALARYAPPRRVGWSPARIDVIRAGFSGR